MPVSNSRAIRDINDSETCVVWHCRNLRTQDHPAIDYAATHYDNILPVFIFDPAFYTGSGLACDARIQFLHECLSDLNEQYTTVNGSLHFLHNDPIQSLERLSNAGLDVVTTADPTGRYGLRRDNEAAETCDVTFIDADGLVRQETDTRDEWSSHVEEWLTDGQHAFTGDRVSVCDLDSPVTIPEIAQKYDVTPEKDIDRTGGTSPGETQLQEFIESITEYPGSISSPVDARSGTSQLSPYLRFGCLSIRQVYQAVDEACSDGRAKQMFVSRLYWNKHYNQKLADWHGWMDEAVNPVMRGFHADTHDESLVAAWKHGETGYPMVDASMRCLKQTGWLNFRMRAMCASFLCDLLQQPWKIGADWFYYHLLDADPAINYTQFQIQAGVDGTNMMRVYNPRKQVRDNDPDGEFIKKWVPELQSLPVTHLDQPEKTPVSVQENVGVSIGDEYPYPVVEYEAARQQILEKFDRVKHDAKQALEHPEVARRASLSNRGGSEPTEEPNRNGTSETDDGSGVQSSLGEYS